MKDNQTSHVVEAGESAKKIFGMRQGNICEESHVKITQKLQLFITNEDIRYWGI
jgi:hypothetical protein